MQNTALDCEGGVAGAISCTSFPGSFLAGVGEKPPSSVAVCTCTVHVLSVVHTLNRGDDNKASHPADPADHGP